MAVLLMLLHDRWFHGMNRAVHCLLMLLVTLLLCVSTANGTQSSDPVSSDASLHATHHRAAGSGNNSEFNHHAAGVGDVLFGLAELGIALQYSLPVWTRFALPTVLGAVGVFLLVWSHHEAWPVGSLSFADTFWGHDREIIEHKLYGILALVIACCEALRRMGRVRHPAWAAPLVIMTCVASLMLFVHSHGDHPAAEKIEFHHALLGTVGVCAALSKGLASWLPGPSPRAVKRWEAAWAGCIIFFGLLLLVYSE